MFDSIPAADPLALRGDADPQALAVDTLLADNDALIARIKLSFGLDRPSFTREILPLIRAYADYVNWLPATASDFFDRPGGLFRLGLETGFYSVQGTDAHIFSGQLTISARRHLEPRWRQATFIAGLCSELHRAIGQVSVVDEAGRTWQAILQPLSTWLRARPSRKFRLQWHSHAGETRALGLLVLPRVVPDTTLQFLADGNEVVVPHLLACIGGLPLYRGRNALDDLVRRAFALVVERDLSTHNPTNTTSPRSPHLVRYLVESMQRLMVDDPAWVPNGEKSRVWYADDGLFVIWPAAAGDLYRFLEAEQLAGMPKTSDAMLERFAAAGVIEPASDGGWLWHIQPRAAEAALTALKLASPDLLLGAAGAVTAPLPARLCPGAPEPAPEPVASEGEQLSLMAAEVAGATPAASTAPAARTRPRQLNAPLRLDASVRQVLTRILAETDQDIGDPQAGSDGLFIPLSRFEAHRLAPPTALRALADAEMLVRDGAAASPIVRRRDSSGKEVNGVVLQPRFVRLSVPP